jgi:hypothetical protein
MPSMRGNAASPAIEAVTDSQANGHASRPETHAWLFARSTLARSKCHARCPVSILRLCSACRPRVLRPFERMIALTARNGFKVLFALHDAGKRSPALRRIDGTGTSPTLITATKRVAP